jgi:hypothetical protein
MNGERETSNVPACPNCNGDTVLFTGAGKDTRFQICSRVNQPGHLDAREIQRLIAGVRVRLNPSGRQA